MRKLMFVLFLCACSPPAQDEDQPAETLTATADGLRDAAGREVLLHGFNARVEGLFDVTFDDGRTALEVIPPFTGEDCAFMAEELGLNLLRLPINWSGLEPERDVYDEAYMQAVVDLANDCAAHGVYTLVDLHQDAYSKEIGEDGAPLWAIIPEPEVLLEGPLTEGELAERRTSSDVLAAFSSFFQNVDGLQDEYAEMAAWVAEALEPCPGVIGLELMNEPVAFQEDRLADFHARVAEQVRAASPGMTLFFEPDALRNLLDTAPTNRLFGYEDSVYSPHIYTDVFTTGWASEDVEALHASVERAAQEARAHQAAALVGEFGHDPRTATGQLYIETALDAFDAHRMSWAIWLYEEWSQGSWGLYDAEGESRGAVRDWLADAVARPYPQAVAGTLVGYAWDDVERLLRVNLSETTAQSVHRVSASSRIWAEVVAACDGQPVELSDHGAGWVEVPCDGSELTLGTSTP